MKQCVDAVILDFDGTLVESVGIKDRAFEMLFSAHPEKLGEIMEYHLAHNATVRFEKFEHIYTNILKLPYTDRERDMLSREFSELVFQAIVECSFVPGAVEFLEEFTVLVPLYLVSMSPEDELERILSARRLRRFFGDVYSSRWKKTDAVSDILRRESARASRVVFIGDALEDRRSAQESGVRFIGRDSGKPFGSPNVPVFPDMASIGDFLKSDRLSGFLTQSE